MPELSLLRRGDPLADPSAQLVILDGAFPSFDRRLADDGAPPLCAGGVETLQVNVGRVCNQTCRHCHVDAGPDRREAMSEAIARACLDLLIDRGIPTLDITGGAPEMNPNFRLLVERAAEAGRQVIDRCNLTILTAPGYEDLAEFLAAHRVTIVASLPCYLEENVDKQRGDRVFARSIEALRLLNRLGYGRDGGPELQLVFNPIGPSLPPDQQKLEADYRRELRERYGIEFSRLLTITNLPISRFLDDLQRTGRLAAYATRLTEAFRGDNVPRLMCRATLSVDWRGFLYDCDFNQMLDLGARVDDRSESTGGDSRIGPRLHLSDLDDATWERLARRRIVTAGHCFGCTAGAGSSCGGSLSAGA
ncbi:MAG TPA: radical SAM protein [Planctomycetaceae bacterium]|nr:radical SAM protein [Planctomycetaceae bacterium]HRF01362.1 arsenosugar biosynthesis radical SAM protein ArsS [Pirellulaceae bacterium]